MDINWGPLLTTAGGLVFGGGSADRNFRAWDARSGRLLWEYKTNSGVTGVPSTYMVDGVQYIAVQSGWGVDAQRMTGRLNDSMKRSVQVRSNSLPIRFATSPRAPSIWVKLRLLKYGEEPWKSAVSC
jgi:outer membrane protein assembly factor BamB